MPRVPQAETDRRVKEFKINILNGDTIQNALVKAGYNKNMKKDKSVPLTKAYQEIKDKFNDEYLKACEDLKLNGTTVATRLAKTALGEDDFNSTSALKTHMQYISKLGEKSQEYTHLSGQIIIPVQINVQDWNKPVNQVEVEIVKDDNKQQNIVDEPVTEQPSDSLT